MLFWLINGTEPGRAAPYRADTARLCCFITRPGSVVYRTGVLTGALAQKAAITSVPGINKLQ